MARRLHLGVNIDHVATIRNARGGAHPDPARAAALACDAGADGITFHLREDRRHIRDDDLARIARDVRLPTNMEMAPVDEMVGIALAHRPHTVTLVPEKRAERTTEGGLDVCANERTLAAMVERLHESGVRVSLFIEPEEEQLRAAARLGAQACEFHTGRYANLCPGNDNDARQREVARIARCAALAEDIGIAPVAGHGLTYENVGPIAAIAQITELNIGHFLVGEALFVGFAEAIARMRAAMDAVR